MAWWSVTGPRGGRWTSGRRAAPGWRSGRPGTRSRSAPEDRLIPGRQADAAGVDDQLAGPGAHRPGHVGVAAQDHFRFRVAQAALHLQGGGGPAPGGLQGLQERVQVALGRSVADEHLRQESAGGGLGRQPVQFPGGEPGMGVGVRETPLVRPQGQQLALVVPGDGHPPLGHEELGGFQGQEGAGQAVAQVHHRVHPPAAGVPEHRLQGQEVAMDICQHGDPHGSHSQGRIVHGQAPRPFASRNGS